MYQVVVERAAEKDLKRLASEVRLRAITAIQALAKNPRPAGCRKLAEPKTTGAFALAIIESFTKLPMKSESSESIASAIGATFIGNLISVFR